MLTSQTQRMYSILIHRNEVLAPLQQHPLHLTLPQLEALMPIQQCLGIISGNIKHENRKRVDEDCLEADD